MSAAEKTWSAQNGKNQTVAEIVQNNLKNNLVVYDNKVKIVGQKTISKKDAKGTALNEVVEFTLQVDFVKAPSIVEDEKSRKGGK
jgi:hypothetical protein